MRPDFIVIPTVLVYDKSLQPSDLITYGIVYWYAQLRDSKCIASNQRLGESAGLAVQTIANSLSRLQEKGYVQIILEKEGVRTEIIPLVKYVKVSSTEEGVSSTEEGGVTHLSNRGRTVNKEHTVSIAKLADKIKSSRDSEAIKELFQSYKDLYVKMISDREPHFNWAICHRLAKPLINKFGLPHLQRLLRAYLENEDKFYRTQAWSLTCFLSANTINKLNQNL